MLNVGTICLDINQDLIEKHRQVTGDSSEIVEHVYKTMIENETGLSFDAAIQTFSTKELSLMVKERITIEISAFGG